jgi:NADPH:quinone reductase
LHTTTREEVMRAISVPEYRADARLGEHEKPTAAPGQVLVKVQAAGMNPMDQAIASGFFSERVPAIFPLILGVDLVGVVESVGDGTGLHSIGDRVFGQTFRPGSSGAYADYAAVAADAMAIVPEAVSSEVAASLPTPGVTALQLARTVEPVAGKTIAVVGAGGTVGGFLTQLLVASGATVLAVTLVPQAARVLSYGVQEVFHATGRPAADLRRAAPDGVDALIDLASDPEHFAVLADTVRSGGVAVSSRYAGDLDALAKKNIEGVNFAVQMTTADLRNVAALTAVGLLLPPPIRTVPFEDVPGLLNGVGDAFDGKTVLQPE